MNKCLFLTLISIFVLASNLSICQPIITQGSSAPVYGTSLNFDEMGGPVGVISPNAFSGLGLMEIQAGDGVPTVGDHTVSGGPWVGTGNSFLGNFGVFMTFDKDLTGLSFQTWDPSGPPSPFGGGMGIFVFNDGVEIGSTFITPSWGGIGDEWINITGIFDEVRVLGFGFNPTTYMDNVSWDGASFCSIIDDFEDGDASDWGFFGGNAAGGGGGVLADRPQEGSFYFSTGWGGNGSASVFYGGAFKNFDNLSQVMLPPDPWLRVWVLNQSDATALQYTLEITLREDLDGNGWTNGQEDSFRSDFQFTSASFDDQWALISAPLSSFIDLFTGGDGVFNGKLDEIVLVISGVEGGNGATVEVDFDQFEFCSGPPMGACCFSDGTCTIDTEGNCEAQGGLYQGYNTLCEDPITWYADLDGDGYSDGTTLQTSCQPIGYKALIELSGNGSDDCNDDDPNLTAVGNPCDDEDEMTLDDFINDSCECVGGRIIPTLSQWGLTILSLLFLVIGIAVMRQKRVSIS